MSLIDPGNTFAEVIKAIDEAETDPARHLSIQIDDKLRGAMLAAKATGKSASITIKVVAKPGPERRITLTGDVTAKLPNVVGNEIVLYVDDLGRLHNRPQMALPDITPKPKPVAVKE